MRDFLIKRNKRKMGLALGITITRIRFSNPFHRNPHSPLFTDSSYLIKRRCTLLE